MQSFHSREIIRTLRYFGMLNDTPVFRYLKNNFTAALKLHGNCWKHHEKVTIPSIKAFLEHIEAQGSGAFDPKNIIKTTIGKLMMTLTYGSRNEEALEKLAAVEEDTDIFNETGPCMLLDFCPPLRFFVPCVKNTYNELLHQVMAVRNIFRDLTHKREQILSMENPDVCIDHFFQLLGKPARVGPGMKTYLNRHW